MLRLLLFINELLNLYLILLFVTAVLSWLVVFNVINTRHPVVSIIGDILYRVTEPVLKPIRRYVPNVGGLELFRHLRQHRAPVDSSARTTASG